MFLGMRNPEKVLCLNRIMYSYSQIENRAYLVVVDVILLFINKEIKYSIINLLTATFTFKKKKLFYICTY